MSFYAFNNPPFSSRYIRKKHYICTQKQFIANGKRYKPHKAVLAETGKTNVWLAEQLGVNPTTVSKWCTNTCQPDLHTLSKIAELLNVSRRELLRP